MTGTPPKNLTIDYSSDTGNMTICMQSFPTMNDVISLFAIAPDVPPSMGDVRWDGLTAIHRGMMQIGKAIKKMLIALIKPFLDVLGLGWDALDAAWQSVCGFACHVKDIINDDWNAVTTALKKVWNDPSAKLNLSWIPHPLFDGITSFAVEVGHIIYELSVNFYVFLANQFASLVSQVENAVTGLKDLINALHLPSLPDLSSLTLANIRKMIKDAIANGAATLNDAWLALKAIFKQKFAMIAEVIDSIPSLPNPLIPKSRSLSVEIETAKTNWCSMIVQSIVQWIGDNIIGPIIKLIGSVWPPVGIFPICLTLPIGLLMTAAIASELEKYGVDPSKIKL